MKRPAALRLIRLALFLAGVPVHGAAGVVFEVTSAYHHIRVVDDQGIRTLSFDGSQESRMSLHDPLQGHFEYTEYFHMPWLWNRQLTNVLMIGLGGASTQRAYQHTYPGVRVETAEIDPVVVRAAKDYFGLQESENQQVHVSDGRVFLRRGGGPYGAILVDAYSRNRYGSFIPYHLATKEFFALANERLAADGVLAYNVIGTLQGWQADILGSVYRTMKEVFPQVYLFPAQQSLNVVLVGVKSKETPTPAALQQRANDLIQSKRIQLATFRARLAVMRTEPPANFQRCQVLTDDYAPVDGLLTRGR
jgi:spermidine synthase